MGVAVLVDAAEVSSTGVRVVSVAGVGAMIAQIPRPTDRIRLLFSLHAESISRETSAKPRAMSSATLPSGATLRGVSYANSSAYLGVRFAQPPVGDLRWRAPSPFAHARGQTYNATAFGLPCTQEVEPFSEDCLFLNVFTPVRAAKLPVLVYIHGGCFMADSTRNALFNGTHLVELAARGASGAVPVILVTIQYRLGVYGWLGGDALRDKAGATGNWGLMDQRLALRWVRENIGAFGGDRDRVTLFGHSAGAAAVSAHLVSPASTGLFSRAGVISGTMANWGSHSAEAAERNFEHALASVNCSTLTCLLDVADTDPARLQRAARWSWKGRTPCRDGCSFAPVIDGVEQLDWPLAVARRAPSLTVSFGRVPLLHGTTSTIAAALSRTTTSSTSPTPRRRGATHAFAARGARR